MSQTHSSRHIIMGMVVVLWISLTAIGLWWFQDNTVRPFLGPSDNPQQVQTRYLTDALTPVLEQVATSEPVAMIHFWNPDCLCNQVSRRHFQGLINSQPANVMKRIVVTPDSTTDAQIHDFKTLNPNMDAQVVRLSADALSIPASPAVALFQHTKDQGYRLSYFGAYGFGALCTLSDDNFFPNMIEKMLAGRYGPFINVAGSGCFCGWSSQ